MLYIIVIMSFFSIVVLNRKSYDVWILDGIVVPTAMFIFFSLVAETFVQGNKKLTILVAFFLAAISLVPGLKYQFFYGCFDTPGHYRFTEVIVSSGNVPKTEFYSKSYGGTPGMHILLGCISIVSGISVNDIFKFVFPVVLSIIPFIIYFITKDLLSDTIQKYTIMASSLPIIPAYIVWGTNLGMVPYLFLIAIFMRLIFSKRYQRENWLLFAILGFGLIISHAVTSLFVAFLLLGTPLILKILEMTRESARMSSLGRFPASTSLAPPSLYVVLLATWWTNVSIFDFEALAGYVRTLFTSGNMIPTIPMRFYQIPLLAQLQVLTVFHLGDFVMVVLSLFGLFIFLKKSRRKEFSNETQATYLFLIVLLGIVVLFLSFQFASRFGMFSYSRFIDYAIPLCSPLAGLTLWRVNRFLRSPKIKIRNFAFASFLFVLVSCCLIQFFRCQPLVPRASVLSIDLPENEYTVDIRMMNTIYQIEMISFAERHSSKGRIASDFITRDQMWGFSGPSFFSRHIWHSPLIPNPDKNLEWDLLLLHTVEGGVLSEKAEYRTRERIENIRLEAGILIYDNGESFILSHTP